ncbi:hypothetical protein Ae201684P_002525 [Aphanomyces euteiches]|nr:hypothetical protein Ae201684P_002525 [Aphanomyces euteiches]
MMEGTDEHEPTGVPIPVYIYQCEPQRASNDISLIESRDKIITVSQKGSGSSFSAKVEQIFLNSDEAEVFEHVLEPLLEAYIEGMHVCLLCGGSANTAHRGFLYGEATPRAKPSTGLALLVVDRILERLHQKQASRASLTSFTVYLAFSECFEETIKDLFSTSNKSVVLADSKSFGVDFKDITQMGPITSTMTAKQALDQGRMRCTTATTTHGPAVDFSSAILRIYLQQVLEDGAKTLVSTFDLVDLPALDRLAKLSTTLRLTEGPLLNKALFAFDSVCKSLEATASFPPYDESILTQCLRNALGGDAMTGALLFVAPNDFEGSRGTLQAASLIQKHRRFHLERSYFRSELARIRNNTPGEAAMAMIEKTHELEGKVLQEHMEKFKLREQIETSLKQVAEYRVKCQELVDSEANLRKQILDGEREKLRLSKAIVDLQLQHTALLESVEKDKFDLTTKLLNAENDILELQMKEEQHESLLKSAQDSAAQCALEKKELAVEFVALKANYVALNTSFQKESAKSQQLSLELLSLVNQKKALAAQVEDFEKTKRINEQRDIKMMQDMDASTQREQALGEKLAAEKFKSDKLYQEKVALEFQLKTAMLEAEARQVQYEKTSLEITQGQQAEALANKKTAEDELAKALMKLAAQQEQIKMHETTVLQMNRQISDLQRTVARRTEDNEELLKRCTRLSTDLDVQRNEYRAKLLQFLGQQNLNPSPAAEATAEGSSLSSNQPDKEVIVNEVVRSFQAKENELMETVESLHNRNATLDSRLDMVLSLAVKLRRILEDNHVKCDDIPLDLDNWSEELAAGHAKYDDEFKMLRAKYESIQQELRVQLEKNIHTAEAYKAMLAEKEKDQQQLRTELTFATTERDRLQLLLDKYAKGNVNEEMIRMQETLLKQIQDLRNVQMPQVDNNSTLQSGVNELKQENAMLKEQLKGLQPSTFSRSQMLVFEETERRCVELTTKTIMLQEEVNSLKNLLKTTIAKYQRRIDEMETQNK